MQERRYATATNYSEGFARVKLLQGGFWAFVDREGNLQEGRYEMAHSYSEGFAFVQLQEHSWAFIDKEGNLQEGRYALSLNYPYNFVTVVPGGYDARLNKNGELSLSSEEWKSVIEKDPTMFKFIPFHRFADKEFIKELKSIIKKVLIEKVEVSIASTFENSSNYVKKILQIVANTTKQAKNRIKDYSKEVEKYAEELSVRKEIHKDNQKHLLNQIENFFDEKDE